MRSYQYYRHKTQFKNIRYDPRLKSFIAFMYQHGYKIHHFANILKLSTGTVWRWITKLNGKIKYKRLKIQGLQLKQHNDHLRYLFHNFLFWISYVDNKGGLMDWDLCLKGDKPP